ncbi:MAG: FAD-dependent oxidoreductase [Methylomonas sp.]|jgi:monoamine oxidase|uniref:flavin monoamine oxidase family protein n=1 Tax=Methylomonas sp. TaxID=418 RepID=UPI0025DB10C8|nr:NAD(P)/FAD-dependent oxidoreductase [Methylomonas sp.]MCK9607154.1 FAD-dependent oxidoreductase [Methylomonas sp.]
MLDIAIIGAGLSGLALAEQLQNGERKIAVFEARARGGGRILTQTLADPKLALDLGPTWLWPDQQPRIAKLVHRLRLKLFQQWDKGHGLYQIDAGQAPSLYIDLETHAGSRRIEGGCGQLINGLMQLLPQASIHLQHRLFGLTDRGAYIDLEFATPTVHRHVRARQVVLAAPPRLLADTITFEPPLSAKFIRLLRDTPTWMAGHAKAVLVYEQPFWRQFGFSGNGLLRYHGAVLTELYDACPSDPQKAALFGFFGLPSAVRAYYRENLEERVVQQLTGLFGEQAANPLRISIQDWSTETFTARSEDQIPPNTHPAYGHPLLQLDHWQDKLYFCGTETASREGGYMEGALESAERVYKALML